MKQQALVHFPMPWLTLLGLAIFFGFFVALVYWVYFRKRSKDYDSAAKIPFKHS